ncbi:GlxA family transcriptional regulator [Ancylobacter amanitiformis]|uniref:AraC family carnitine catabolism transcriptional activator n=1 Tax=Ancylobacter amanitiformis TaxID=217069 RepID=A0ABU0LUW7_9HYPH|nr:GlxA family transcriptional regulator [Ancylobacter amanitiformis]MDQ0512454.1 AraC family carnitine catabolism transcriptional activator [Ancylobacter amanitiformis]
MSPIEAPLSGERRAGGPPSFNFILQPEFPLNALVLATEALRIVNQYSGRELFRWRLASEDGNPVRASNGLWMSVDDGLASLPPADFHFVFEGNLPMQRNSPKLLNQLRTAARFGATIGAVDTGAFALAQAGLLKGRSVVLHWEAVPSFRERFPDIAVSSQIYLIDGPRISCAGGVAMLDLILDLIGRLESPSLASEVANALVHVPRPAVTPQRLDDAPRPAARPTLADRIVALMEHNLDFPLALEDIADQLGVSAKTVLRACNRSFDETPMRLYLRIRLQAARNMLFYEEFGIKDVATACGFSYPGVLSRAFHAQFGMTPREFRASLRRQQNQAYRPEVRRLSIGPLAHQALDAAPEPTPKTALDANNESFLIKSDRETGPL